MSILYVYILTVYFAFDKVSLKNFTTTTVKEMGLYPCRKYLFYKLYYNR